jgi:Niemann-Pick C1 protein
MDSYFMAYHTTLKVSEDFYEALRSARRVTDEISNMLKEHLGSSAVEVFPYRYTVSSPKEINLEQYWLTGCNALQTYGSLWVFRRTYWLHLQV